MQAAPPVSAPVGFLGGGSHNDQAGETRGLEGGTKPVKGLSAGERVADTSCYYLVDTSQLGFKSLSFTSLVYHSTNQKVSG